MSRLKLSLRQAIGQKNTFSGTGMELFWTMSITPCVSSTPFSTNTRFRALTANNIDRSFVFPFTTTIRKSDSIFRGSLLSRFAKSSLHVLWRASETCLLCQTDFPSHLRNRQQACGFKSSTWPPMSDKASPVSRSCYRDLVQCWISSMR